MIQHGVDVLKGHDIEPKVFFAPSHIFDENTLVALKEESDIRIISDTIANDVYFENDFYFIPQQSGRVRKLPFKVCTFCYHPNMMKDEDFEELEIFLKGRHSNFASVQDMKLKERPISNFVRVLHAIYFEKRR